MQEAGSGPHTFPDDKRASMESIHRRKSTDLTGMDETGATTTVSRPGQADDFDLVTSGLTSYAGPGNDTESRQTNPLYGMQIPDEFDEPGAQSASPSPLPEEAGNFELPAYLDIARMPRENFANSGFASGFDFGMDMPDDEMVMDQAAGNEHLNIFDPQDNTAFGFPGADQGPTNVPRRQLFSMDMEGFMADSGGGAPVSGGGAAPKRKIFNI